MIKFGSVYFYFDKLVAIKVGKWNTSEEWYVDVYLVDNQKHSQTFSMQSMAELAKNEILRQIKEADVI